MSREIKFRAWDKNRREMKLVKSIEWSSKYNDTTHKHELDKIINFEGWVLMQYTGLKDKNGKEIYEGDIVNGLLKNKADNFSFTHGIVEIGIDGVITNVSDFTLSYYDSIKVIGNIYENPELVN